MKPKNKRKQIIIIFDRLYRLFSYPDPVSAVRTNRTLTIYMVKYHETSDFVQIHRDNGDSEGDDRRVVEHKDKNRKISISFGPALISVR